MFYASKGNNVVTLWVLLKLQLNNSDQMVASTMLQINFEYKKNVS